MVAAVWEKRNYITATVDDERRKMRKNRCIKIYYKSQFCLARNALKIRSRASKKACLKIINKLTLQAISEE